MITTIEKNQIRALISSPGWPVIERLAKEINEMIASEPKSRETEWLTARQVVFDEGRQAGVNKLLSEILNTQL